MRSLLLIFLFSLILFSVNAQPVCSGPGRLPSTAQAVCGNLTFNQQFVTNCTGPNIPNPRAGCGDIVSTDNSLWYKFHCYQSGNFGFLLTPSSPSDDYDWEIMDVTGHAPDDVYTWELRVSLNLSGQTGLTGCTASGTADINCAGGAPGSQFNRLLNLIAGHDYLMMVNNWSNSGLGYALDFSGTAVLTNNIDPTITDVSSLGCNASKVKVIFSEDILCNTITTAGSEFTITNGSNVITGVVSDCNQGANSVPSVIISLQIPLAAGNYQLNISNGTDGNTFENVCRRVMLPVSIPFTVAPVNAVNVDTITFTGCAPTVVDVKLTRPVWCSSITSSGTEFTILPGNIPLASVQPVCSGNALSANLLHINLQTPLPFGNYQLVINNGIDGDTFVDTCNNTMVTGVSIPFVINQTTTAPAVQSISFDECHPDKLMVNFDKPVLCSTISALGNEFTLTPGLWPITAVNYNCGTGNYATQAVLTLQNALPAGNFALKIANGNDGNTLADTCFAFITTGYTKTFVTTQAPAPKFDSVQFDKCNPSFIKIFYSKPIKCSSVSANGSDYFITGPSALNINAAITDASCGLGYTNWVLLQLSQPVNVVGNYLVHNTIGTDGNGISDTCSAVQNNTETILFNALIKPSAAFTNQIRFGCKMDTVIFSHPGGNGINSWSWKFADGTTATGQTVTHLFQVSTVTTSIQLIVTNGFCSDTVSSSITLNNAFKSAFKQNPADTACINTPVNFTDVSTGKNLQYLWLFGDNTQFTGQNPPTHFYTSNILYSTTLIVTDPYGCADTTSNKIYVTALPSIDFTGLAAQYCTDKPLSLARIISNNIYSYTWTNGDGLSFKNQPNVQFSYTNEAVYTITLTGTDKYCGIAQVSKPVSVFAVPKINLGNDTVLCPAVTLPIGVVFNSGYNYLWSTGATSAQINTDIFTSRYSLLVDNNGCKATDAISVKVLSACLIRVTGAFTPNSDGVNDRLKAINADLAKDFSLSVYNRLGKLLFITKNPTDGWDGFYKGVKADAGTYVWQLSYIDPWNNKKIFESGTSILIR
jgi:gliding motility-associated-like protein